MHTPLPPPPALLPFTQVLCQVSAWVTLGPGPHGERRYVPLGGGTVCGPGLNRTVVQGGVDWQIARADGVLDIAAHCVIRADDGALIEVRSEGIRQGPPELMDRLARGEAVDRDACYFRTVVRLTAGAPQWQHLNKMLLLAVGQREAAQAKLDFYRLA